MTEDTKRFAHDCLDCKYFHQSESESERKEGKCHRYPPTAKSNYSQFPHVDITDWCGEWSL